MTKISSVTLAFWLTIVFLPGRKEIFSAVSLEEITGYTSNSTRSLQLARLLHNLTKLFFKGAEELGYFLLRAGVFVAHPSLSDLVTPR